MNDPLHVPYQDLVVFHKGKEAVLINKTLLDRQTCWTNLNKIKELHSERLHLEDMMNKTNDIDFLKLCNELYTLIEFELQDAWGFTRDKKFHRFWNRPKCACPIMDNEDGYLIGRYVISGICPLHGQEA